MTPDRTFRPDHLMDARVAEWLTDTDLTPGEADAGLDRLLHDFPVTPQTRRRLLGRWLDRDEGAGRRTTERDQRPHTDQKNRIILSATGIAAALAALMLAIGSGDTDAPRPIAGASGIRVVAADGSGDYRAIQAAVDAAADGDTISIRPGTYEESVRVENDLTIVGDPTDPSAVVIVVPPGGASDEAWPETMRPHGLLLDGPAVTVSDLTVHVPVGATGIGSTGGSPQIERVSVIRIGAEDPDLHDWYSLGFYGETSPTVRDSWWDAYTAVREGAAAVFEGNTVSHALISIDGPGETVVRDNTFVDAGAVNTTGARVTIEGNDFTGGSVTADIASRVEVRDNVFRDIVAGSDSGDTAIAVQDFGSHAVVVNNTVSNAFRGIRITLGASAEIRGNALTTNSVGITNSSTGNVVIDGNSVDGDGAGIVLARGTRTSITGNAIDVTGRGIAIAGASSSTIDGNTICGGDASIYFLNPPPAQELGENDVC